MRGGTSKGVFFLAEDLPCGPCGTRPHPDARDRQPRPLRQADRRHGRRHLEHQQGRHPVEVQARRTATSTTCSARSPIDKPLVDWSGNCGNLVAAVGPFADQHGPGRRAGRRHGDGAISGRPTSGRGSSSHVPMSDGAVQELGDFQLDGVAFPAAEVQLEFLDPADDEGGEGGRDVPDRQPYRRARRARPRHDRGDPDQCRQSRRCSSTPRGSASPAPSCRSDVNGDKALLARVEAVRALRRGRHGRCRDAGGGDRQAPAHAQARLRRQAGRLHRVRRQAPSRRARSTCWRASSRWACCTTP